MTIDRHRTNGTLPEEYRDQVENVVGRHRILTQALVVAALVCSLGAVASLARWLEPEPTSSLPTVYAVVDFSSYSWSRPDSIAVTILGTGDERQVTITDYNLPRVLRGDTVEVHYDPLQPEATQIPSRRPFPVRVIFFTLAAFILANRAFMFARAARAMHGVLDSDEWDEGTLAWRVRRGVIYPFSAPRPTIGFVEVFGQTTPIRANHWQRHSTLPEPVLIHPAAGRLIVTKSTGKARFHPLSKIAA